MKDCLATQIAPNGARAGTRLRSAAEPAVRAVATGSMMQVVATHVLGAAAFPLRAIYFDKTASANLLHASSAATEPGHRRVMHIEYACEPLPAGLEWFERCA